MSLCDKCIHKDVCKNVTNVNESEGVVCPNRLVILFLCDKRADCKGPCYIDCHHTTDVRHAKNFERVQQYSDLDSDYGVFVEVESDEDFEEDDDWTALKERPFEGRPGTDA